MRIRPVRGAARLAPPLLAALLAASCARPAALLSPPPPPQQQREAAAIGGAPVCQVGPDGGPLNPDQGYRAADRGIGGTGAAAAPPALRQADRGIGGTGSPAGVQVADRGIGGTGIIAVITGFASVCLAGQEVALDPDAPVLVGSRPASGAELRAGHVALIDAAGEPGAGGLRARRVEVRYEVTGPVQEVTGDGAALRVAGQPVAVAETTLGLRPRAAGGWIAVSGLRRPDGVVEATRIDPAAPGEVVVHGRLVREEGRLLRVGTLLVRPAPGVPVLDGRDVTAVGRLEGGALRAEQLAPDLLATDPGALFRAGVGGLLVESFAVLEGARVRFGQGFAAAAAPSFAPGFAPGLGARRAVLSLERGGDSGLRATSLRSAAGLAAGPSLPGSAVPPGRPGGAAPAPSTPRFEPAPVPNRAIRTPGSNGGGAGRFGASDRAGGRTTGRVRSGRIGRDGDPAEGGAAGDPGAGRGGFGSGPFPGGLGGPGRSR